MINFPDAPTINQVVTSPNGLSWSWNGSAWLLVGVGLGGGGSSGGGCIADSIPPPNPDVGDMWYDTTSGRTYIWYDNTWSEMTGVPSSISAMDLLGTTLAPNVVNASLRNVTSTGALTLSGGAGAITQVLAPGAAGALVLQAASESLVYIDSTGIYLQPNAGDRLYIGGRSAYLPIVFGSAYASTDLAVTSTGTIIPGMSLSFAGCKTGDIIAIDGLLDVVSVAAPAQFVGASTVNGSGILNSWRTASAAGARQMQPLLAFYTVPSDGTYVVAATAMCFEGAGKYKVVGTSGGASPGYASVLRATVYGMR